MNHLACLHFTERSADILLAQLEIKDARDQLGEYLAMPTKLTEYVNVPILLTQLLSTDRSRNYAYTTSHPNLHPRTSPSSITQTPKYSSTPP